MASGDDDRIPELTEAETIRWRAAESDLTAMSEALNNGTATPADVDGAFARLMALDIDHHKHRNALHIPPDAGDHVAAIEAILRRIPDGWGRWLSVDAGWYPLVIATDKQLALLDPYYRVHQIKEKFGRLRFYAKYVPRSNETDQKVAESIFNSIIYSAEATSANMCDQCGRWATSDTDANGWLRTRCENHKDQK